MSRLALVALAAYLGACSADALPTEDERTASTVQQVVTDVVPTSANCVQGIGKGNCVSVPVVHQPLPSPIGSDRRGHEFVLDGKRGGAEYQGAVRLPYENQEWRASGGTVWVLAEKFGIPRMVDEVSFPAGQLHVYLENIPVPVDQAGGMFQGEQGQSPRGLILIGIDNHRFSGPTDSVSGEDQLYAVDLVNGVVESAYEWDYSFPWFGRWSRRGPWWWEPTWVKSDLQFGVVRGGCRIDPEDQSSNLMRCNAELTLPLPESAFGPPAQGLDPGIGFMVTASTDSGMAQAAMPSQLVSDTEHVRVTKRKGWQTLLFGRPKGFDLTYMSWNVRRASTKPLRITDSAENRAMAREIGRFLASYDIVALQEVWNDEQAHWILEAANLERKRLGKPPFHLYGGDGFGSSKITSMVNDALHDISSTLDGENDAPDNATNGLYILTSLQRADGGQIIFDDCKGEDCFKPKGAQWLRLYINPPSKSNSQDCRQQALEVPRPCDLPPSGGDYVDIFNVHTQASNPYICPRLDEIADEIAEFSGDFKKLAEDMFVKIPLWAFARFDSKLSCDVDDEEIRHRQLVQLNEYITRTTAEFRDRPVIIMGDFNIDGRDIRPESEYASMIQTLKIGPSPGRVSQDGFQSDIINPWRWDFTWDIDHGDVARERPDIDWNSGDCVGTFIGTGESGDNPGGPKTSCRLDGMYDGGPRLDFILVRPPTVPNDPDYQSLAYVVAKQPDSPVWRSPWPGLPGNFGPVPERLSDHKPVVASFRHVRLEMPPVFHPTWKHRVEWRVSSLNASWMDDCDGPVDPLVRLHWGNVDAMQGYLEEGTHKGATCSQDATVSYTSDDCTYNWYGDMSHDGSKNASIPASYLWVRAWDADTGWCGGV